MRAEDVETVPIDGPELPLVTSGQVDSPPRAAYDDAPDLIEGLTAAIVEGYRGGCESGDDGDLGRMRSGVARVGCIQGGSPRP